MNEEKRKTPYDLVGGAAGVRRLVDAFYDRMDTLPEAYGIRKLHPADLSGSREKLFMYLSGYLGGPNLFIEKFGHPRLRSRHLPFAIGAGERDQWLLCFRQAIDATIENPALREALWKPIAELADFMRNQPAAE